MDELRTRHSGWEKALQIGGHSLPATIALTALAVAAALWWGPALAFALGSGWVAPFAVAMSLFFLLLLFRKTLFTPANHPAREGDEALLAFFVQQNAGAGSEEEMAVELLENALQLKDVRAQDCMAPRPEIVYIDVGAPMEELRQLFIESSLSRILVTDGEMDNILGYVHVRQLFSRPRRIRDIVLPITFVPQTIVANELLNKFIRSRTSIACVVDEYGSLAGLVTLEDALEQLFGAIDDEHDQEEFIEAKISDTEYLFSGRLRVDYLNEKYPGLHIPAGDYQTLSGFLVAVMATIPEQGARLHLEDKTYVLELVSDRKIETVRVLFDNI